MNKLTAGKAIKVLKACVDSWLLGEYSGEISVCTCLYLSLLPSTGHYFWFGFETLIDAAMLQV